MKNGLYLRLAAGGIRKNRQLYLPYLATCTGMVTIRNLLGCLARSGWIASMPGGAEVGLMLNFGVWVITVFAAVFLFYTNSFLIRRRKKEFGLYNLLGMGKRAIAQVLAWEIALSYLVSLAVGFLLSAGLSKLAELILLKLIGAAASTAMPFSTAVCGQDALVFGALFLLLYTNTLRQLIRAKPVELMRSEQTGEKPPKANYLLSLGGVIILAAAYYLAVTIQNPLSALMVFFVAVLMVILATYLLFLSGSVTLCRTLQKRKRYYYQPSHFISVSSMAFRMKRNGAGLASVCILLTMVLVTLSSTTCLYVGREDSLNTRYPRDIIISVDLESTQHGNEKALEGIRQVSRQLQEAHGLTASNVLDYRQTTITGLLEDGVLVWDSAEAQEHFVLDTYENLVQVFILPLEDYNARLGCSETLEPDEVLISPYRTSYPFDFFQIEDCQRYQVKATADGFLTDGDAAMLLIPSLYVVVPDYDAAVEPLLFLTDYQGDRLIWPSWEYGFDLTGSDEAQTAYCEDLEKAMKALLLGGEADGLYNVALDCKARQRSDFYTTFGALFFLGVLLSAVFLAAAVLILYYKQITEGYEDQPRFAILQKIGMTRQEIRKSVNSQMCTVFLLPLLTAGCHLCFAFPLVRKLLLMFNLRNTGLLIATTAGCYLVFAAFYIAVYRLTSNSYYHIVSGGKE